MLKQARKQEQKYKSNKHKDTLPTKIDQGIRKHVQEKSNQKNKSRLPLSLSP